MMSMEQLITEHMDVWTGAMERRSSAGRGGGKKVRYHGVNTLRNLIFDLAVNGKLTEQKDEDEPASILFEKLSDEKITLQSELKLKIKKTQNKVQGCLDIRPILPSNWRWSTLDELAILITDGTHRTPEYLGTGVPFISVKDINGETVSFDDCKYISMKEHLEINSRCNPEIGDVLICRIGTLGRATIVDTDRPFSLFVSVGLIKLPQRFVLPAYSKIVFTSPLLTSQYQKIKAGGSHTNKLNLSELPKLEIPLPH